MNIVDSSAWLSYFAGDANAEVFSTPIENIDKLIVSSIVNAAVNPLIFVAEPLPIKRQLI